MEDALDVRDEINERITKIKSIVACLLAINDSVLELNHKQIYGVIWTIDGLVDELKNLYDKSLDIV